MANGDQQVGRMLVEGGFLTGEQLQKAMELVLQQGKSLREVLAEKGWVNTETYTTVLSLQSRVPIVDLREVRIEQWAIDFVPEAVARQCKTLPFMVDGDSLRVAMDNPLDSEAINALSAVSGKKIKPRIPLQGSTLEFINKHYLGDALQDTELPNV